MALQLRRGTDAERLTITPAEGELIYTTDTKLIYVGDGSTLGGTKADSGITDLLSDTSPQLGGNLDLNSQTITGTGAISIVGNISGNTVAGSSGNFTSSVIGSLSAASIQGDLTGSVFADDSTMLVDGTDGKLVLSNNDIQDLNNVYVPTTPTAGDALIWNNVDSRWEAGNPAVSGGVFDGDIQGSVFGDDSTLIVDGLNNKIHTDEIISPTLNVDLQADGNRTSFTFQRNEPTLDMALAFYDLGIVRFRGNDINGENTWSFIRGRNTDIIMGAGGFLEDFPDSSLFIHGAQITSVGMIDGPARFNVGGEIFCTSTVIGASGKFTTLQADDSSVFYNGETNEVFAGSATLAGSLDANSVNATEINGNIIDNSSSVVFDSAASTITAGGFMQFGSYNTTERNALTAANGMIIYNSQVNRFQGYQNGAWINIDDGTAA